MAFYGDGKHNENMEYIDDSDEIEDWETTYFVDIPQCFNGEPIDEWRTIKEFKTNEEALKYAQEHFGADENGMICLISSY